MTASYENAACLRAEDNLSREIISAQKFPKMVFSSKWVQFHFFDSDWIFVSKFSETVRAIIKKEGSSCVCMSQLNYIDGQTKGRRSFFLHEETTTFEYGSALFSGSEIAESWVVNMDRFGCISDSGRWVIYCERRNEIAVIAFEDGKAAQDLLPLIEHFKALPIDEAIRVQGSFGFTDAALSPEWKSELIEHYANQRGT